MPSRPRSTTAARRPDDSVAAALDRFRRIVRALRLAARQVERESALSPAQLFVLGQIAAEPGQSITELAGRTLTDRSSAAGMVDRLAARGLVRRVRGTEDRRRVQLELTPDGEAVMARAPSSPTERLLAALQQLDAATVDRLADDLGTLARVMGAAEGPVTMLFEDDES